MGDHDVTTPRDAPMTGNATIAPEGDDTLVHLRLVFDALRRRRRLVVRVAGGTLLLAIAITILSARVYVANATVQISQDRPVLGGVPDLSLFARQVDPITSEIEILRSRTNAEEVVRQLLLRIELISTPGGEWHFASFEFGRLADFLAEKTALESEDARLRIEESLSRADGKDAWQRIEARRKGYRQRLDAVEKQIADERRRTERLADLRGRFRIRLGSEAGSFVVEDGEGAALGSGRNWRYESDDFSFELVPPSAARDRVMAGAVLELEIERERTATADLLNRVKIQPLGRTNVIEVVVEAPSAEEAALTANALVDVYLERARNIRAEQAAQRKSFVKSQVDLVEANLHAAEREVSDYKSGNALMALSDEAELLLQPWTQNEVELARTQSAVVEARALLEKLGGIAADADAPLLIVPVGLPEGSTVASLIGRLTELEVTRKQLLAGRRSDHPEVQRVTAAIQGVRSQLVHELGALVAGLEERERSLGSVVDGFKEQIRKLPEKELGLAHRLLESRVNEELYGTLRREYAQAEIAEASTLSNAWPVDRAIEPLRASRPRVVFNVAAGIFFGVFLGVGLALLREYLDRSVRSTVQLERLGLGAFGVIPKIEIDRTARAAPVRSDAPARRSLRLLLRDDVPGLVVEAYRSLRTNIRFAMTASDGGTLAFTSAAPAEGKSLTAANLAISLAENGARVLLIDADLRRPSLARIFGERTSGRRGLSECLAGDGDWRDLLVPTAVEGLELLPGGRVPPNPAELLASNRLGELIRDARASGYDFVIVDTPPVLPFTDASVAARSLERIFVVVRSGKTTVDSVRRSLNVLAAGGARIAGAILNGVDYEEMFGVGSYIDYYSHYLSESDDEREKGRFAWISRFLPLRKRSRGTTLGDEKLPAWARSESKSGGDERGRLASSSDARATERPQARDVESESPESRRNERDERAPAHSPARGARELESDRPAPRVEKANEGARGSTAGHESPRRRNKRRRRQRS